MNTKNDYSISFWIIAIFVLGAGIAGYYFSHLEPEQQLSRIYITKNEAGEVLISGNFSLINKEGQTIKTTATTEQLALAQLAEIQEKHRIYLLWELSQDQFYLDTVTVDRPYVVVSSENVIKSPEGNTAILFDENAKISSVQIQPSIILIPKITETPIQDPILREEFEKIEKELNKSLISSVAYTKPERMFLNETITIDLVINPSVSEEQLATEFANFTDLATSTANPSVLIMPNGEEAKIVTSEINVTPRMKVLLITPNPEAFIVVPLQENSEQIISLRDPTNWRWSITAKKEGLQTLELIVYRLLKYEGEDHWREVGSYKANIVVDVTVANRIKSIDWKWVLGIAVTLILIPAFWRWIDLRRKEKEKDEGKNKVLKRIK